MWTCGENKWWVTVSYMWPVNVCCVTVRDEKLAANTCVMQRFLSKPRKDLIQRYITVAYYLWEKQWFDHICSKDCHIHASYCAALSIYHQHFDTPLLCFPWSSHCRQHVALIVLSKSKQINSLIHQVLLSLAAFLSLSLTCSIILCNFFTFLHSLSQVFLFFIALKKLQ